MTHINQRTDFKPNWAASNPVLQAGEVGWEKDTGLAKLGDGVTPWNGLPYTKAIVSVNKADVGLGNVDNTRDVDKPVSAATQAALNTKAPLDSPAFTGNPTAPTPTAGDSDASVATSAFVQAAITAAITAAKLAMHPVGDIKMTTVNVNPSTYLGGTWVAWGSGRVPVGVNTSDTDFNTVEKTGGAKTHSHSLSDAGWAQITMSTTIVMHRRISIPAASSYVESFRVTATGGTAQTGQATATGLGGATDAATNVQPYITCYMWKRTA